MQRYVASHLKTAIFDTGLRAYAAYRDLGIKDATAGEAIAHVIRFSPPCTDDVRIWHTHDITFQMVYVLKGWIVTQMDGREPERMDVGSCWLQPPKIRHRVVDYSDDCEVLEIVLPGDFETHMES